MSKLKVRRLHSAPSKVVSLPKARARARNPRKDPKYRTLGAQSIRQLPQMIALNPEHLSTPYTLERFESRLVDWDRIQIDIRGVPGVIGLLPDGNPEIGYCHQIEIELHEEFPHKIPKVVPKTPIFHPNVKDLVEICWIGIWDLERAECCFENLLLNTVEILQYKKINYAHNHLMNREAYEWHHSRYGEHGTPPGLEPAFQMQRLFREPHKRISLPNSRGREQ